LGPPIFGQMPHQHADVGERLQRWYYQWPR